MLPYMVGSMSNVTLLEQYHPEAKLYLCVAGQHLYNVTVHQKVMTYRYDGPVVMTDCPLQQ